MAGQRDPQGSIDFLRRRTPSAIATLVRFIDEYRKVFTVESICRVLYEHGWTIASSTYRAAVKRSPSVRARRDEDLKAAITALHAENYGVFGARKVWLVLNRQGTVVARCTIERLMRELGPRGVVRGKNRRTTIADEHAVRPADLVQRHFTTDRPNRLWVADFTYVATWSGTVGLIQHTDAGAQYTSIVFTSRLLDAGVDASVGSVGDAYAVSEPLNSVLKVRVWL